MAATIKFIWTDFHTLDDDKDRDDGISEPYMLDSNRLLARNQSWGKDLVFREDSWDKGQVFDIGHANIPLTEVHRIKNKFDMDTDDGWNVVMHVHVKDSDGIEYEVGRQLWNIGDGNPRSGEMELRWNQ